MALNYVNLTGSYADAEGNNTVEGSLVFTPSALLTDAADKKTIPASPVTVQLNPVGQFSIPLLATDNVSLSPSGWFYTVVINLNGVQVTHTFNLLFASGATQDISSITWLS